MQPSFDEVALIETALVAIEQALARSAVNDQAVSFHAQTDLDSLPDLEREALLHAEDESYRARPEQCAIQFCLHSAAALLDVSQALMQSPSNPSPERRAADLKRLVAHTKTAGRAAYRAALILTDTKRG